MWQAVCCLIVNVVLVSSENCAIGRARKEIAARKATNEEHRDLELEQAFVAWAAYRTGGGQERFEVWRQRWMKDKEGQDGR